MHIFLTCIHLCFFNCRSLYCNLLPQQLLGLSQAQGLDARVPALALGREGEGPLSPLDLQHDIPTYNCEKASIVQQLPPRRCLTANCSFDSQRSLDR